MNGYAEAARIDISQIPVIDVGGLLTGEPGALQRVAGEMARAAETIGFFYIENYGIPAELTKQVFALADEFFHRPMEEKDLIAVNRLHRGFIRTGEARMHEGAKPDLKESFVWGLDVGEDDPDYLAGRALIGPNQWPQAPLEMRPVLMRYFDACNSLAWVLFGAFATSLYISPERFSGAVDRPVTRCSIIYYPPQPPSMGEDQFGVAPHTDFGCLTLLSQDANGGLQVQGRDGVWLEAAPIEGTLVVNVGDLMARWTNDRFASTPHRVVNTSGRERISLVAAVDPNFESVIAPVVGEGEEAHYEPTTCGDYLVWRLGKSFAYDDKS